MVYILSVRDSCNCWASSGVIVARGCRCRCWGTADFSSGLFVFFFFFFLRGSKIGLRSPGFEPGFRTFVT